MLVDDETFQPICFVPKDFDGLKFFGFVIENRELVLFEVAQMNVHDQIKKLIKGIVKDLAQGSQFQFSLGSFFQEDSELVEQIG